MTVVYRLAMLTNGVLVGVAISRGYWLLAGIAGFGAVMGFLATSPVRPRRETPDVEYLDK